MSTPPQRPCRGRVAYVGQMAVALLVLHGLSGCTPALDWHTLRLPEVAVEVLLPCRPSVFARSLRLASEAVVWNLHSCRAADFNWAAGHAKFSSVAAAERAMSELQEHAPGDTSNTTASSPWRRDLAAPSGSAKHWRRNAKLGDGRQVHMHMALMQRDQHVVQLLAIGEQADNEAVEMFLDSLQSKAPR